MNLELEKLIELQKTDTNLRRLKKAIETSDERRAELEQEFERHAFEIRDIQNQAESAKTERADLERQISEAKTHLERAERNLKHSQNQKEYEAAMREADTLQKQIAALETEVIEKMTTVEEVEKVLEERADEISSLEGDHQKVVADFSAQLAADKTEYEKALKKRTEVLKTVPANMANVYDRLAMRSRDGIAVAEVKNNSCSACFMQLRPQMMVEIKTSTRIITCESCTRILYIIGDESLSEATA